MHQEKPASAGFSFGVQVSRIVARCRHAASYSRDPSRTSSADSGRAEYTGIEAAPITS
jgi:hypothetical protein